MNNPHYVRVVFNQVSPSPLPSTPFCNNLIFSAFFFTVNGNPFPYKLLLLILRKFQPKSRIVRPLTKYVFFLIRWQ